MATMIATTRPTIGFKTLKWIARTSPLTLSRALTTLPGNADIFVHEPSEDTKSNQYLYSYLKRSPPTPSLVIGSSPNFPPTAESFEENHHFLDILHYVMKDHAAKDPEVQAQAALFASQAGSSLGSGGAFFPGSRKKGVTQGGGGGAFGDGAGGASAQGGMGGAGRGGFVHVSDTRNPPDFGRVAWPEDIFGSLELDGDGNFTDGSGRYQRSGTYRIMTHGGTLGLTPYLKERLVEKLGELDEQARKNAG